MNGVAGRPKLAFLLFLLLFGGIRCQPTRYLSAGDLARRATGLLAAHDIATLVGLFHVPATYSAHERRQEFRALESLLDIVYDELGSPLQFRFPAAPTSTLTFSVGSGDFVYWQEHRGVLAFTYDVRFVRAGPGQLVIRLFRVSSESEWQIRDIGFGLSTQTPDAKVRIQRIASQAAKTLGLQKPRNVLQPRT